MRKVNIQSHKQPWVSHSHWDSKAFNRNTHSLFPINRTRASMCTDLNSVFSIPGKPARHHSHRLQTGWAAGLGSFYLVLAIGVAFVLCKALRLLFFAVCSPVCLFKSVCAALTEWPGMDSSGTTETCFFLFWRLGSSGSRCRHLPSLLRSDFLVQRWQLSTVSSHGRR